MYSAVLLLEAAMKKARSTDTEKFIRAMEDLSVPSPVGVGPGGTVTMRGRDHQMIYYGAAWAVSVPQEPYFTNVSMTPWDKMIQEETVWLKNKGWL